MEDSASAVGGAADSTPTPISRAHAYAAAAEEFTEQHDRPRAIDAHFRAAEQFMLAVNFASDPEAIRTLKLLYANHTRQGKELQRRVAVSTSRGATAGKEKIQTAGTSQQSAGHSGLPDAPPTPEAQTPPPPSSASTGYCQLRPSSQPAESPAPYVPPPDSTADRPGHSPTPLAAAAAHAPGTPAQPDDSRPLGHPPFARHQHSGSPSSAASPSLGRTTHIQPSFAAAHGLRASPRETDGQPQFFSYEGLRSERLPEFGSYSTHGLPNTGHAILPVQSLDTSFMHASQANAKSQPIDESYMVLKDKDDDGDDSDPFNKFWEIVEGLMQKISNPVAFATAPLGGPNGLGDNQAAVQSYPDHTFLPVRHIPQPFASSYVSVREGMEVNPPNPAPPPDMAEVHGPGRPAQDLSRAGLGSGQLASGRRDVAESAYFIVPGRDGILASNRRYGIANGSGSPDLHRHSTGSSPSERVRPGTGSSSSTQLGPGLVNTSQVISPRGLPRSGSKTMEEYAIENHQLKMTVDFLSQRVASLERAAEENTMLKSSLYQFRQEVSRHAKRIMQSQEIMRSSMFSSVRPSRADNSASNAQVSRLQSKLHELEEEVRVAKQEAEKHSLMSAKYRGKWEKLKEAARKKRHHVGDSQGGPPLLGGTGDGEAPSPAPSSDPPPDPSRENLGRGRRQSGDDADAPDVPGRLGAPPLREEGSSEVGEYDDRPGESQRLEGLRDEGARGDEGQAAEARAPEAQSVETVPS